MTHTAGNWEFVLTSYGDLSPCYAVKSAEFGYIVANAFGQTDSEALANAMRIADAVTLMNKDAGNDAQT